MNAEGFSRHGGYTRLIADRYDDERQNKHERDVNKYVTTIYAKDFS